MWSKDDIEQARAVLTDGSAGYLSHSQMAAIMTRAVELKAASGGTMDAATLEQNLSGLEQGTTTAAMVREHIATLGARLAVAEQERRVYMQANADVCKERDALSANFTVACRKADEQRERAEKAEAERDALGGELLLARHLAEAQFYRADDAESRLQRMRDGINGMVKRCVEMAKVLGEPPTQASTPKNQGEGRCAAPFASGKLCWLEPGHPGPHMALVAPYPCSPTCTHDDAATPGHLERVKEGSAAFATDADGRRPENCGDTFRTIPNGVDGAPFTRSQLERYAEKSAEAMRAACLLAVENECWKAGLSPHQWLTFKAAIEGATP